MQNSFLGAQGRMRIPSHGKLLRRMMTRLLLLTGAIGAAFAGTLTYSSQSGFAASAGPLTTITFQRAQRRLHDLCQWLDAFLRNVHRHTSGRPKRQHNKPEFLLLRLFARVHQPER